MHYPFRAREKKERESDVNFIKINQFVMMKNAFAVIKRKMGKKHEKKLIIGSTMRGKVVFAGSFLPTGINTV
jgi:hypothetical protein